MEFLKRNWAQVQVYLGELSASQKWLIASLLVILLMVGGLLMIYAGGAERVAVSQFSGNRAEQVLARLRRAGVDAELDGGQVMVPADQQDNAIVLLAQDDLLSADASDAFNELVPSPWETDAQGRRKFLVAKQQVLGSIIGKMKGVRSAAVIISMPEDQGFGRTFDRPTASASLTMDGGKRVDKNLINAVAGLVAGAVAELPPTNVTVIDSNLGRSFTVDDPDDMMPGQSVELVRQEEDRQRKKIEQYLAIPGAIVAVNVRQDPVQKELREETTYMETEPLRSTLKEDTQRRDINRQGEPGPRSNTGASIDGAGAQGTVETTSRKEEEFGDKLPTMHSRKTLVGHQTDQINVTVNVPRRYFVQIFKARNPQTQDEPDQAALAPIVQQQLGEIESKLTPLIASGDTQGVVKASMFFDNAYLDPQAAASAGDGVGSVLPRDWVQPVTIASLCLLALGMMVMMVRKATREEALPSVEELAGVPPTLPNEDDLVGEADEMDAAMAGVEMTDDEIRTRRVAEQISDMIKASPDEAGSLLGKWVQTDE